MQRMFLPGFTVVATIALLGLAGCTSTTSAAPASTESPDDSPAITARQPLSGSFVSQGANTTGTVALIPTTGDEFAIVLTDFSTSAASDLRVNLSTGPLVTGADGYHYVDAPDQLEMPGTIDPSDPTQIFVFPIDFWTDGIQSFTVYNYADRVAYGSASLKRADVSLPPWASEPIAVADSGSRPGAMGALSPNTTAVDTYAIAPGDTASDIATRFNVGLEQLIDKNDVRIGSYPELQPYERIRFGSPLSGSNYDCFFGTIPSPGNGKSCYELPN